MDNDRIDFLVESILSRVEESYKKFNEAIQLDDREKTIRLCEAIGELEAELIFVKDELLDNKKPTRRRFRIFRR